MKERNSTFELLRIIAITFIMIHHVIVFGLGGCNYELNVEHCDTNPWINDIINSLCIIGVNLFILITGWFGVKSVSRSLFRLLPVYLCVVLFVMIQRQDISQDTWCMKEWWYIPNFCMLILFSPMIESSLVNIDKRKFTFYIVLLTIINILFGYHWKYVNGNGYNFVNFVYLYYIARYLRIMKDSRYFKYFYQHGIGIWLISSILLGTFHTWRVLGGHEYDSISYFGYNNPLVLLSSISLFCWFSAREIKSKLINFIAGGTFAVYLVSTKEFGPLHIGSMGASAYEHFSYLGMLLYAISLTALIYIPSSIICWLCQKIPMPNLLMKIDRK